MILKRSCAALLLALAASSSAAAADPARVERYIELTRMQQTMAQMPAMMLASAEQSLLQSATARGLDDTQRAKARELLAVQFAGVAEVLSWDSMKPELAALLGETFADAELDAANAYLSSPEGQSIVAKQPQLMQQSIAIAQRRTAEVMPGLKAEIQRVMRQFEEANEGGGETRADDSR